MVNIRADDDQEPEEVLAQFSLEQRVRRAAGCRAAQGLPVGRWALLPPLLPCRAGCMAVLLGPASAHHHAPRPWGRGLGPCRAAAPPPVLM